MIAINPGGTAASGDKYLTSGTDAYQVVGGAYYNVSP